MCQTKGYCDDAPTEIGLTTNRGGHMGKHWGEHRPAGAAGRSIGLTSKGPVETVLQDQFLPAGGSKKSFLLPMRARRGHPRLKCHRCELVGIYLVVNRGAPGTASHNGGFTGVLSGASGMTGKSK